MEVRRGPQPPAPFPAVGDASQGAVAANKRGPLERSPPLTVRRVTSAKNGQWQDFIDREQSSVDELMRESFAAYCRRKRSESGGNSRMRSGSFDGSADNDAATVSAPRMFSTGSLSRAPLKEKLRLPLTSLSTATMPRKPSPAVQARELARRTADMKLRIEEDGDMAVARSGSSTGLLPPGIEELESLYAPMKNLLEPLPNQIAPSSNGSMPEPHPIWTYPGLPPRMSPPRKDDDQVSVVSSVVIPPPLPPVQSHAVLESSIGHLPRTPLRQSKFSKVVAPPAPPKRASSKTSLADNQQSSSHRHRPQHLGLSPQPSHFEASQNVYANAKAILHRSSLMSTGSSENSSDTSLPSCCAGSSSLGAASAGGAHDAGSSEAAPVTPATPTEQEPTSTAFAWPSYSVKINKASDMPSPIDDHRSISRLNSSTPTPLATDDARPSSAAAGGSLSGVYVRMNPVFPAHDRESRYMNVLYNAVQRQGGGGSVEAAISPYLSMGGAGNRSSTADVRTMPEARPEGVSAIYARPESVLSKKSSSSSRARSNSTSRLQEVTRKASRKFRSSSTSSNLVKSKARALAEFKELMREVERKREFRVGLNIFNSRPSLGVEYLVQRGFLEASPSAVADFLLQPGSGLAQEKIGEYLCDPSNPFASRVLSRFMSGLDFSGLRLDKALRRLLSHMRAPGEAQSVERMVEAFAKRYVEANSNFSNKLRRPRDSAAALAFAAVLLNTDLHSPAALRALNHKRMTSADFVDNLQSSGDAGADLDAKLLRNVYKGVKKRELRGGEDHVLQTRVLQASIVNAGDKLGELAEPQRRLVCLCRLYEVADIGRREPEGDNRHPRDLFLFNDLLLVTKQQLSGGRGGSPSYSLRESIPLSGLEVTLFHTPVFEHGIQLSRKGGRVLLTLNARDERDRYKFVMDLQESIFEVAAMERAMSEMLPPTSVSCSSVSDGRE